MEAAAVPLALAPAFSTPHILNFSEPAAAKLVKSAIKPLSIIFNHSPVNLYLFIDQARNKSIIYAWLNILSIPLGGDVASTKDLIKTFGEIPYYDDRNHTLSCMNGESRDA